MLVTGVSPRPPPRGPQPSGSLSLPRTTPSLGDGSPGQGREARAPGPPSGTFSSEHTGAEGSVSWKSHHKAWSSCATRRGPSWTDTPLCRAGDQGPDLFWGRAGVDTPGPPLKPAGRLCFKLTSCRFPEFNGPEELPGPSLEATCHVLLGGLRGPLLSRTDLLS